MNKIYYISQGETIQDHLLNIESACKAGCKLIQIRLKNLDDRNYYLAAKKAKDICDLFKADLIVNDNAKVAKAIGAKGVHVGKQDEEPGKVRSVIGDDVWLGGTANTLQDCLRLIELKVDYIGLGPLRFTSTKTNLSPVLGIEGYTKILKVIRSRNKKIPVFAIGGIELIDLDGLGNTGITGVAVSGLLSNKSAEELNKNIESLHKATRAWKDIKKL